MASSFRAPALRAPLRRPRVLIPHHYPTSQLQQHRQFSNTSSTLAVGPESPRWLKVPTPPQPRASPHRWIKGVLPLPRNIFPKSGLKKTSLGYMAATTPEPIISPLASRGRIQPHQEPGRVAYRARLAATRREHLREGLMRLADRQDALRKRRTDTRKAKREAREALVSAEPEVWDKHTEASASAPLRRLLGGKPARADERRTMEEVRRSAARIQRATERRTEAMLEDLHALYIKAGEFIVNEAQLEGAVERAFGTQEKPVLFGASKRRVSVWAEKPPPTTADLLAQMQAAERGIGSNRYAVQTMDRAGLEQQRLKRLAEELTGGEVDESRKF
ncbi:hypothetical protein BDY21DRAFT_359679 [Lineolata rhizophorae]|uniref:Uncharacterized protein n=1 Tax=Lineolata rhizophorae TaxID=578093 RepID=A0A6A6NKV8_9PEZI|nr:hypothetical protein BDY21DRAFT_359679 [Lineolata rhizophorae]